jgi:hypothetical protein
MGSLAAQIDQEWAQGIKGHEVWSYNIGAAEDLYGEVKLEQLGGLVVPLTSELIFTNERVAMAERARSIVNLAFGELAVETDTISLVRAALEQRGEEDLLTEQLKNQNRQTNQHGPNRPWFLPLSGVKVIELVTASRTD